MDITFKKRDLEKCANDDKRCKKKLGKNADVYKLRLDQLKFAESLEDCRHLPGRYHELTGNRKGQWACDLKGSDRLIFEPHEKPIPINEDGQYIWIEIHGVEILEIKDYH